MSEFDRFLLSLQLTKTSDEEKRMTDFTSFPKLLLVKARQQQNEGVVSFADIQRQAKRFSGGTARANARFRNCGKITGDSIDETEG